MWHVCVRCFPCYDCVNHVSCCLLASLGPVSAAGCSMPLHMYIGGWFKSVKPRLPPRPPSVRIFSTLCLWSCISSPVWGQPEQSALLFPTLLSVLLCYRRASKSPPPQRTNPLFAAHDPRAYTRESVSYRSLSCPFYPSSLSFSTALSCVCTNASR